MGCDIHMHVEIKIEDSWHHYSAPNVDRWYQMFEKMAGVRGSLENAISEPKGLPADATEMTMIASRHDASDGHSHSWLSTDEIMQLEDWLKAQPATSMLDNDLEHSILNTYLFGNSFTGWKKYPQDNRDGVQDVRFIFWFDC